MHTIHVSGRSFKGNEKKYLNQCIESGWISSEGPFVKRFEKEFSSSVNRKYGIAVTNGTAALDIAILSLGIGPGDEVIMPAFTIISCASAIVRAGAKPVLVDVDENTWNMDTSQIESKITKHTKAIMVVHTYGLPVDMSKVISLAKKHKLEIIEDAAEAHGLLYKKKPCGSFGKISIFSFYANKLITTGEGGMIVTNDEKIAEKCKKLRNLCFGPKRFVHEELGFNQRMTNLQAALGVAQLEQIKKFKERKIEIGKKYTELLKNHPKIQLPLTKTKYAENVYWVYGMVLKNTDLMAEEVMKRLADRGIESRPFFWPMHEQPVFKEMHLFKNQKFSISEKLARKGFYIPNGINLTEKEIKKVVMVLKEII